MKRFLLIASLLLPSLAVAQSTSVTATITDTDGQTWNNGAVTATFVPGPPQSYTWPGGTIPLTVSGTMNGSGQFTISLPDNSTITPIGSQWRFTLCPNASAPCVSTSIAVAGASIDLSSQLSSVAKGPRFPASPWAYGYRDVEISPTPPDGAIYWNVTDGFSRQWTGSSWENMQGGSVTSFGTGTWPSWLTPSVANPSTTPTLSVAASAIPNSALAGPLVNSISNSDGSLTISPTTGSVVGSLNIAHSNTWTALQSFAGIDNSGGYTQTGTDTNTFTGNTSVYVGTSDLQLGSGLTFPNTGPSFTWNIGSDNETDFINTSNLESEAFAWYSFAPGAVSPYPSPIMTLDLGGALTTNNIQATGYFVQTGTGGNSFSGPSSFATITNSGGYTQSGTAANTFTGTVTAPTFSGALSGNATTATTAPVLPKTLETPVAGVPVRNE